MNESQIYVVLAIVVLLIVALLAVFVRQRGGTRLLTPLTSLAIVFVIAGTVFGENRILGYGLMGIGIILALIDIFNRVRRG